MSNSWSQKSYNAYITLDPDLRILCDSILPEHDCSILWGYRSEDIQNDLYARGLSKLKFPQSKHNKYFSEAVDLIPYAKGLDPYGDPRYVTYFCGMVLGHADRLYQNGKMAKRVRWGGNWSTSRANPFSSFFDAYHFELL